MWRFLNIFRKPIPQGYKVTEKYIPFGSGDCWPLKWAEAIENSPSAASCLSTKKDFMKGFGFSDTQLEKLVVNARNETMWQVHQQTVDSFAQYEGFYWLVRFNAMGQVTDWQVLPFENCRLGTPDDNGWIAQVHYNPFFGTQDYKINKNTTCYDVWNPEGLKDQIQQQGNNFKGQVYFYGTTSPLSRYYPRPEATSAMKWMEIESGVATYHEGNINRGFMPKLMLTVFGNGDEPSKNPDYQDFHGDRPATVSEELQNQINENFMGAKEAPNLWINFVNNKDEKAIFDAIPNTATGDLFITLDNQAIKKITIAWKVPSILANINEGVSLGGDGNMVRVAVKLMQHRVIDEQRELTDAYQVILRAMLKPYVEPVVIVPYNPYPELEVLDPQIWAALSTEEQRKWIQDNTEIELAPTETVAPAQQKLFNAIHELKKGDKVKVKPGSAHSKEHEDMVMVVDYVSAENAVAVKMPDGTIHKWYVSSELEKSDIQMTNKVINAIPIRVPESVLNAIKKTRKYMDTMGSTCGGKWGTEVSDKILNNVSLGQSEMKRVFNYLKKNEANANRPYNEGCDVIQYHQLGGKDMHDFLENELTRLKAWLN